MTMEMATPYAITVAATTMPKQSPLSNGRYRACHRIRTDVPRTAAHYALVSLP